MNLFKHIALLLGIILISLTGFTQSDTIIVIDAKGEGDRIINPTTKEVLSPSLIEDTTKSQIKEDFVFYEYRANSTLQLQPITPAKLKIIQPLDKLKRGYIKGGIGMYTTPLVEVYYNSLRSKTNNWGVHGRHLSSNSSIQNTGFSGLSENQANAFYQHFYKKFSLTGTVNYDRSVNHFYGFNSEDSTLDLASLEKDNIKQIFTTIGGGVRFSSYNKDSSDVNVNGTLNYLNFSDNYLSKENKVLLDFNLQKRINKYEVFDLDFGVDFNNYKSTGIPGINGDPTEQFSELTMNNTIVKLNPKIVSNRKKLFVSFGLAVVADATDKTKFHFYPNVEAKYSFFDIFIPYIGANGGLERNSFRTLTNENPFLLSQVGLRNTNTKYNFYGGIRGSISNTITFNTQIARKKIESEALFVSDTTYSIENKMDVIYEALDLTEINAQITFQDGEKIRVFLKGKYSFFNPLNEDFIWNRAPLEITLGGVYDLADKLLVRADIFFVGERKAKSLLFVEGAELNKDNTYAVNQKAFFDFNLGFEYRYSKNISAFVNFNNIIGQQYLLYYQYPVQSINIMGGATFRF